MFIGRYKIGTLISMVIILSGIFGLACGGGDSDGVVLPVKIEGGQLVPNVLDVSLKDKVTLRIESDEAGTLSVQRYNVSREVKPGEIADLEFVAVRLIRPEGGGVTQRNFDILFQRPGQAQSEPIGRLTVK